MMKDGRSLHSSPLLLCIALDQLLINIRANRADRLLFQVLRLGDACCLALFLDLRRCLLRSHDTHILLNVYILNGREYSSP